MPLQSEVIISLDFHFPYRHIIYFRERQECQSIENTKLTVLLAFFELNPSHPSAREYKYIVIPLHYFYEIVDAQKGLR